MKAIVYARVSTKEQADEGYSLESQEKLLQDYAVKMGYEVMKTYKISESASGRHLRKLFNEVFAYSEKQKIDILLCEKIDRLTRNPKDAGVADDWVHGGEGREIHFIKESFVLNKNTRAHENLVWDMKVAIARFYSNNLSEEVRKGHAEKLAQGWYPSKAPLGYLSTGEKGHKTHIQDPIKAPLLCKMFELYSTGNHSLKALVDIMYELGLRSSLGNKIVKSRIGSMLSDPFYYGAILWKGGIYPGNQPPIVSKELYDKVHGILKGKAVPRNNKHNYTFKGRIRCEDCNGLVTWEKHKGIIYGHCNAYNNCPKKKWYRQTDLESQVLPAFNKLKLNNPRLGDWINKAIKTGQQNDDQMHTLATTQLKGQLVQIINRLDKLYDDKVDGKIPEDMYNRKHLQYREEQKTIEQAIAKHDTDGGDDKYDQLKLSLYELSQRASEIFQKAEIPQQVTLLSLVVTNLKLKGGVLTYEYTEPFKVLLDAIDKTNSSINSNFPKNDTRTIEPSISGIDKTKSTTFEVMRSVWLGREDSNL